MPIKEVAIDDSLSEDLPNEFEIIQMVCVDSAVRVRLEGRAVSSGSEQAIIGIKNLTGEDSKPFASQAPRIDALLVCEGHHQSAFHFIRRAEP